MSGRPQQTCSGMIVSKPIALEHPDRGLGNVWLVVVHGAAVEVDDSLVGPGAALERAAIGALCTAPLPGRLERALGEPREGRLAVHAEHSLEYHAHDTIVEGEVGERGEQDTHRPDEVGLAEAPVSKAWGSCPHAGGLGPAGCSSRRSSPRPDRRRCTSHSRSSSPPSDRGSADASSPGPGPAGARRGGIAVPAVLRTSARRTGRSPA